MTDRPILFSAPMIRALLDGRKTQTRRVLRDVPTPPAHDNVVHEPKHDAPYFDAYCGGKRTPENPRGMTENWCWWTRDDRAGYGCKVGYVPGDRLWVRETWHCDYAEMPIGNFPAMRERTDYRATHDCREWEAGCPCKDADGRGLWRPSIHMPRWASRLTLIVTGVRVQRLQDISEVGATAEGAERLAMDDDGKFYQHEAGTFRAGFAGLWDHINGPRGFGWDANPWVVALTFTVHRCNIDQMGAA